jgi:hypothetical protein
MSVAINYEILQRMFRKISAHTHTAIYEACEKIHAFITLSEVYSSTAETGTD